VTPLAGRGGGEQAVPSGPGKAIFREDADRLVLSNPLISIAFSAADGAIVSLHNRRAQVEMVDVQEATAEGALWRCRVQSPDGGSVTLSSRNCAEFAHSLENDVGGGLDLRLVWRGLQAGAEAVDGTVTATIVFPAEGSTAWMSLKVQLPERLSLESLDFPCVTALGAADLLTDESLFLPLSDGVLVSEPRLALAALGPNAVCEAVYPGPASAQLCGFSSADRTTVWLGSGDNSGARKALVAGASSRSNRVSLWIAQSAILDADGAWTPGYPFALGIVTGDWFEAAREYRSWAVDQPWCQRGKGGERGLPSLTASYGLWLSHWGDARPAVAATRELQRVVNVPIKLDWRCWHKCLCGGAYPDYFPPRDGEEAFAGAKGQLAESGVLLQLSFSGLLASPDSESWQAEDAGRYAARDFREGDSGLVRMCPATRYWRQKLVALAREAVRSGAEGIYLADLGCAEPLQCHDVAHGHAAAAPGYWGTSVRRALGEVRAAVGRSINLTTDGPNETCLDLVDALVTSHAAAEREGAFAALFGTRWSPIPLFEAIYHSYTTLVGPGSSLVNYRPHDPLERVSLSELRLPTPVMTRDFHGQFCLEIARAAAWGHQTMLSNFSPEQAQGDANRRKLIFLWTVLRAQSWGVGALLAYSEFMGPLAVETTPVELEMLVNPPDSQPSDRRVVRRALSPIVGSAWRTPGGGPALMLVNSHDQQLDFATRLRSARLGVSLPIQLIGRTFSEDGDVSDATLRTSGSEISGRLPARSVILLTLR